MVLMIRENSLMSRGTSINGGMRKAQQVSEIKPSVSLVSSNYFTSIQGVPIKNILISDQYSDFSVSEVGVSLNGLNTQGENIADNGGIKQAFRAYTSWRDTNGPEQPLPSLPVSCNN